jgi:hypothetical protein
VLRRRLSYFGILLVLYLGERRLRSSKLAKESLENTPIVPYTSIPFIKSFLFSNGKLIFEAFRGRDDAKLENTRPSTCSTSSTPPSPAKAGTCSVPQPEVSFGGFFF